GIDLSITFAESVDRFVKACTWLGDRDLPALKLLRAIAKQMDEDLEAGEDVQTYRMAQFNTIQYRLLQRDPDAKAKPAAAPKDDGAQMLDMFLNNPGVWKAS
ncbi:hypothetical protein, partial [Mycolicibacterium sp.]